MKKFLFVVVALAMIMTLGAQTPTSTMPVGWGGGVAPAFATQLSQCPTVASGFYIATVIPATGAPFLCESVAGYNGGAPFQLTFPQPKVAVQSVNGKLPDANGNVAITLSTTTGTSVTGATLE